MKDRTIRPQTVTSETESRKSKLARIIYGVFILLIASYAHAQEIKTVVGGNRHESTWILIDGAIEAGATVRLRQHLESKYLSEGVAPPKVALNSPGGNLIEGIKMGLLMRDLEISTTIGRQTATYEEGGSENVEWGWVTSSNASCASACAYAFLGGVDRYMPEGSRFGVHQFYRSSSNYDLNENLSVDKINSDAQRITGALVEYLDHLNDISFLLLSEAAEASKDEMNWISRERAIELGVVTGEYFSDFFLEPYGDGIIAASRATVSETGYDTTRTYYKVGQATTFCRGSKKTLMLSSEAKADLSILGWSVDWHFYDERGGIDKVSYEDIASVRTLEGKTYVDIDVSDFYWKIIESTKFSVSVPVPRSEGGNFTFEKSISAKEADMIEASFRLCI